MKSGHDVFKESLHHLLRHAIHKGCDVRLSSGSLMCPDGWPRRTLLPHRYRWKVVAAYPLRTAHINILELQAVLQTLKWRSREASAIRTRIVHATDSQVVLSVIAKGRSSSRTLNFALTRLNALLLCASMQIALVYVRTDLNPADRPSRWGRRPGK